MNVEIGFADTPNGMSGSEVLALNGPTLDVQIGYDAAYYRNSKFSPVLGVGKISALVDTGAADSCIDNLLTAELGLMVVDRRLIGGVGGLHLANVYLAQIYVPALGFTQAGQFAGVDLRAGGQTHQALIGRTFLKFFRMVYEGDTGRVTLTDIAVHKSLPGR